jgi:hypothetical protein
VSCRPSNDVLAIKLSGDVKFTLNSIFVTRGGTTVISANSTVKDTTAVAISGLHPGADYDVAVSFVGFEGTANSLAVSMPSIMPTDPNNFANLTNVLHQQSDPAVAGPTFSVVNMIIVAWLLAFVPALLRGGVTKVMDENKSNNKIKANDNDSPRSRNEHDTNLFSSSSGSSSRSSADDEQRDIELDGDVGAGSDEKATPVTQTELRPLSRALMLAHLIAVCGFLVAMILAGAVAQPLSGLSSKDMASLMYLAAALRCSPFS